MDHREGLKGPLPGYAKINNYLENKPIQSLKKYPQQKQVLLLKSKLFNERKKNRMRIMKTVKQLFI